jgi:hypothetical protein
MEENTAFTIGREWLRTRASTERLGALADTLQRIAIEPEAHAVTADDRLALLVRKELWIVTIDLETTDVTAVTIERVDLSAKRMRLRLTESHGVSGHDRPEISYTWHLELGDERAALRFEVLGEPYRYGQRSGSPAVVFGWRLAQVLGWTAPT